MSDPLDLAPIEARLNAATRGPWKWDGHRVPTLIGLAGDRDVYEFEYEVIEADHHGECGCRSACQLDLAVSEADAEFIANTPADIAALLAEVKTLRAKVADVWDAGYRAGWIDRCRYADGQPFSTNPHRAVATEART